VKFYRGSQNPFFIKDGARVHTGPGGQGVRAEGKLHHVVWHSPPGMNWGYAGSGPADLALSILVDFFSERGDDVQRVMGGETFPFSDQVRSVGLYQAFKRDFVATWGDTWEITEPEIQEWVDGQGVAS
jgi:hypothetical protein